MSSKSESSIGNKVVHRGIPKKCACGGGVKRYTSATTENPGRPFFRCESMVKKDHFFKWVEEAVLEEVEDLIPIVDHVDCEVNKLLSNVDATITEIYDLHSEVLQVKKEI